MSKHILFCLAVATAAGFGSCSNHGNGGRLETVLRAAGENRPELERVLAHYSEDPADSLKLKAAVFLIENMPGHISVHGKDVDEFYADINAVLDRGLPNEATLDSVNGLLEGFAPHGPVYRQDMEIIGADFLIHNIDAAFEAWEKPWARHLEFGEFAEFLLPYKYMEGQRLDMWRDTLVARYGGMLDARPLDDLKYNYAFNTNDALFNEFARLNGWSGYGGNPPGEVSPFYNSSSIHRIRFADCNIHAAAMVALMRANGVGAAFEYMPQWGDLNGRHAWYSIFNNNGRVVPTAYIGAREVAFLPYNSLPKFYRRMYSSDRREEKYIAQSKYIFNRFVMFDRDVTSEYIAVSDIAVPVDGAGLEDKKYVHIAVSSYRGWDVADYGILKNGRAHFEDLGRNVVYMVYGFDGKGLVPISDPFLLDTKGNIRYFRPDDGDLREATFFRKYPKTHNAAFAERRMVGSRVEASNSPDFKSPVVLHVFEDSDFGRVIPSGTGARYRYWRCVADPEQVLNIAELQFFAEGSDTPMKGRVIGTSDLSYLESTMPEAAFDGDWLTYYDSGIHEEVAWVGFDFGRPVRVDRIMGVPRSDDNAVHLGDTYELVYWGDGRWNSLGTRTAADNRVTYGSIPANALLMLRDLTQGKDERIFSLEGSRQVWH